MGHIQTGEIKVECVLKVGTPILVRTRNTVKTANTDTGIARRLLDGRAPGARISGGAVAFGIRAQHPGDGLASEAKIFFLEGLTFGSGCAILWSHSRKTHQEPTEMSRKVSKNSKTATHRQVANCTVKFAETKDFLGDKMFYIVYSNGESNTLSEKRFNELFVVA